MWCAFLFKKDCVYALQAYPVRHTTQAGLQRREARSWKTGMMAISLLWLLPLLLEWALIEQVGVTAFSDSCVVNIKLLEMYNGLFPYSLRL